MAEPSAIAAALVQKIRDANSIDEKRSATDTLLVKVRREGRDEAVAAAGAVRAAAELFMECDD